MFGRSRSLLRSLGFGLGALGLSLGLCACQSDRERLAAHLEKASELAEQAAPGPDAALLELRNALVIEPQHVGVHNRIAEILNTQQRFSEAIFYYEEALHLDPENVSANSRLAQLLRDRDPDRAAKLVANALRADPTSAISYAARAELNLDRGDMEAAFADSQRAVELDPESSLIQWVLAETLFAQASDLRRTGKTVDPDQLDTGLLALDRYTELSGAADPWSALPHRARFLALLPQRRENALAAWRKTMDETAGKDVPEYVKLSAALAARDLARQWRIETLGEEAIERLVELQPQNMEYWDELASVRESLEGTGGETLLALLKSNPDNPEAHLRYAGYLRAVEGRRAAIAYLVKHAENDALRPDLLGALSELHDQAGETEDFDRILETLAEEYPWHHATLMVRGKAALQRGDADEASRQLGRLVAQGGSAESASLLASAESARRDHPATLKAISRAIEIDAGQIERLLPLRAHAYSQMGECERAVGPYTRLDRKNRLRPDERILFGRCLYDIGENARALQVLLVGIREGDPNNGALLEIASREEANPAYRVRIRRLLRAALERDPEDIRISTRLSAIDHQLGENELALSRLEGFRQKGPLPPETRLLRARLLAATGDLATARTELEELFQNRPDLKGILPVLLATLLELNDKPGTLAALERGERFGLLGAGRYLLFGTLLLEAGDQNEARRVLEKAVLSGSLSPEVLSQLALLYARENVDLEKAEYYAGRAVAESGESPESLDTLGFVLLERGQNQAAAQKLEEALEAAGPNDPASTAGTHYRLGVARQRLGQAELAQRHFARAHLLDPRIAVPGPADPKNEL